MVKLDTFKVVGSILKRLFFMTARPCAGIIRNFRPGFAFFIWHWNIIHYLHKSVKLSSDCSGYSGFEVAFNAINFIMSRSPPALIKCLHVMARRAEAGSWSKFGRCSKYYNKQNYINSEKQKKPSETAHVFKKTLFLFKFIIFFFHFSMNMFIRSNLILWLL